MANTIFFKTGFDSLFQRRVNGNVNKEYFNTLNHIIDTHKFFTCFFHFFWDNKCLLWHLKSFWSRSLFSRNLNRFNFLLIANALTLTHTVNTWNAGRAVATCWLLGKSPGNCLLSNIYWPFWVSSFWSVWQASTTRTFCMPLHAWLVYSTMYTSPSSSLDFNSRTSGENFFWASNKSSHMLCIKSYLQVILCIDRFVIPLKRIW